MPASVTESTAQPRTAPRQDPISPRPPAVPAEERRPVSRLPEPATPRRSVSASAVALWAAIAVVLVGWTLPLEHYLTPRSGVGYWLGIIGGSLMLALLIYPLRKRVRRLSFIGPPRVWFQVHMVLGVVGPICIVYHCVYRLGATNSNVAFVSMAIVAISGIVGRYLYGRIHSGLYGHKTNLSELRKEAAELRIEASGNIRLLPELAARLEAAEARILSSTPLVPKALSAVWHWRVERARIGHYIRHAIRDAARESRPIAQQRKKLVATAFRYSDGRLRAARRVAEFESCDQLFALWHVLHLPLFGMLFVAGIVHVIAVNIY